MTELKERVIDETFIGGYCSTRWSGNLLEWGFGFTRGVCKALYGDPIPLKDQEPVYAIGQRPGGLIRVTGYYGKEFMPTLSSALKTEGFTTVASGDVTVNLKSRSGTEDVDRGTDASVASFTVRVANLPYWRPEFQKCFYLHKDNSGIRDFVVGPGYVEFNLPQDQTRVTPHGETAVRKPAPRVDLPTDLAGIVALAESLGLQVLPHTIGTIIKERV